VKPLKPSNDYIFFGRLEPYKGIARLKEAWELVLKQNPDATLLIRGMGPNSDELRALDNMPGVDCEIGYIENNMVENLMRDVKVILAPYDSATQSGVTGIAATFGMLAIATPCEGFIEQAKYNSRIIIADDFLPASFAISMLEARKAWDWNSIHEDLIISTGFVDELFDV
jgi:glycosyltransferase involved in cell wall biosynthesis